MRLRIWEIEGGYKLGNENCPLGIQENIGISLVCLVIRRDWELIMNKYQKY